MDFTKRIRRGELSVLTANNGSKMADHEIQLAVGRRPIEQIIGDLGLKDIAEPHTRLFAKLPWDISAYKGGSFEAHQRDISAYGGNSEAHQIAFTSLVHPTPLGSGKTSAAIGALDGLNAIELYSAVFVMRQPSAGVTWNRKGGAGGGGFAQVLGAMYVNNRFLGDFDALVNITNEIIAKTMALIRSKRLNFEAIDFALATDVCAQYLKNLMVSPTGDNDTEKKHYHIRTEIITAHELLKVFSFARNLQELEEGIGNMTLGLNSNGEPVYVRELGTVPAYISRLAEPFMPNLAQSLLGSPILIHGGLFGNVGTGCPTIVSQLVAEKLAKYVLVEAGFSAELGFEKLANVQMRMLNRQTPFYTPDRQRSLDAVIGVVNIRDLKRAGGVVPTDADRQIYPVDAKGVERGIVNLRRHLGNVAAYYRVRDRPGKAPIGVSITFADNPDEVKVVTDYLDSLRVPWVINRSWENGGAAGGRELAEMVKGLVSRTDAPQFRMLYDAGKDNLSPAQCIDILIGQYLGVEQRVDYASGVREKAEALFKRYGPAQVIMAKTFLSFGEKPDQLPVPSPDYRMKITNIRWESGAKVYVVSVGEQNLMPGKVIKDGTPEDAVVKPIAAPGWPGGYMPGR